MPLVSPLMPVLHGGTSFCLQMGWMDACTDQYTVQSSL